MRPSPAHPVHNRIRQSSNAALPSRHRAPCGGNVWMVSQKAKEIQLPDSRPNPPTQSGAVILPWVSQEAIQP